MKPADLKKEMTAYSRIYYWSSHSNDYLLTEYFLEEIGISPFLPLYKEESAIMASIHSENQNMAKFFLFQGDFVYEGKQVTDFKVKIKPDLDVRDVANWSQQVYKLKNEQDRDYFETSRKSKDECGNNSMHFAFNIQNEEVRNKFVDLLLHTGVGNSR